MTPRHLRVFLSSPGDVAEERTIARSILDRLPSDPLLKEKVTIAVESWDDPDAPTPMPANLTPQQAVDRGLPRPSQCDLTVVIFWGRMGTPLSEPRKADRSQYLSGTEYEFEDGKKAGKPILLYRRTAKVLSDADDPDFDEKRRQKRLVDQFFEQFRNPDRSLSAGFHQYETVEGFKKDFEAHVKALVARLLESGGQQVVDAKSRDSTSAARRPTIPRAYLDSLKARCASVELLGLRLKQGQAVKLNNVYVPLTTTGGTDERHRDKPQEAVERDRERVSLLLDRLGDGSLYVSGDPGSGKSTFCRWLTWLACEGAVPPVDVEPPDEYRERLPPALTNRLPLLVYLREFWGSLPDPSQTPALSIRQLEDALVRWCAEKDVAGLETDLIKAHVDRGTSLLVLDGIDEVPPARRTLLLGGLAGACDAWSKRGKIGRAHV